MVTIDPAGGQYTAMGQYTYKPGNVSNSVCLPCPCPEDEEGHSLSVPGVQPCTNCGQNYHFYAGDGLEWCYECEDNRVRTCATCGSEGKFGWNRHDEEGCCYTCWLTNYAARNSVGDWPYAKQYLADLAAGLVERRVDFV